MTQKYQFGWKVQYQKSDKKSNLVSVIVEDAWVIAETAEQGLQKLTSSMPSATILFPLNKSYKLSKGW